jgi:hypothetical protein
MPPVGKSIVGLVEARQCFRPSLGCQSMTGQCKQGEGKAVENTVGGLSARRTSAGAGTRCNQYDGNNSPGTKRGRPNHLAAKPATAN